MPYKTMEYVIKMFTGQKLKALLRIFPCDCVCAFVLLLKQKLNSCWVYDPFQHILSHIDMGISSWKNKRKFNIKFLPKTNIYILVYKYISSLSAILISMSRRLIDFLQNDQMENKLSINIAIFYPQYFIIICLTQEINKNKHQI